MSHDAKESKKTATQAFPLMEATAGEEVKFVSAEGGRDFQHRLAEMGLVPGVKFKILKKGHPGPFLILLKETRLMLGRGMIDRIFISKAD